MARSIVTFGEATPQDEHIFQLAQRLTEINARLAIVESMAATTNALAQGAYNLAVTGGGVITPTLNPLTLSTLTGAVNTPFVATIGGATTGSGITASASDGTALAVVNNIVSGTFVTAGSPNITLTESYMGIVRSTVLPAVISGGGVIVPPAPTFVSQPSLSPTTVNVGSPVTITPGVVVNGTVTTRTALLNGTALTITGNVVTPSVAGMLTYQETATGAGGSVQSTVVSATVNAGVVTPFPSVARAITNYALTPLDIFVVTGLANVGMPYRLLPAWKGGQGTNMTFALSGGSALPAGYTFSTTTGELLFTPTTVADITGLSISVTDGTTTVNTGTFMIPVAAAPVVIAGTGVATTDTPAVANAIAAGQSVRLTGAHVWNAPVELISRTAIYGENGSVRLADGTNTRLITNKNRATTDRTDQHMAVYQTGPFSWDTETGQTKVGTGLQHVFPFVSAANVRIQGTPAYPVSIRGVVMCGLFVGCLGCAHVYVKYNQSGLVNQDGLDVGPGTSNLHVEYITGLVGDDAFSFFAKKSQTGYSTMVIDTPWKDGADTTRMIVNNVAVNCGLENMFRLQAGNGFKLYNLHGRNITNTRAYGSQPNFLIQLGNIRYIVTKGAAADLTDISFDGVTGFTSLLNQDLPHSNIRIRNTVQDRRIGATPSTGTLQLISAPDDDTRAANNAASNVIVDGITDTAGTSHGQLYGLRSGNTMDVLVLKNIQLTKLAKLLTLPAAGLTNVALDTITVTTAGTTIDSRNDTTGTINNVNLGGTQLGTTGGIIASGSTPTPVSISGTPGSATVGTAYSYTPTTANGSGTKTFALSGSALPAGLSFSTTTGAITGTPTTAATTSGIIITVTDTTGSASQTVSITVAAAGTVTRTLVYSDTFTGADGTLVGHTPEMGTGWVAPVGNSFLISSNKIRPGTMPSQSQIANTLSGVTDYDLEVELSFVTAITGVTRSIAFDTVNNTATYKVAGLVNGAGWQIRQIASGGSTILGTTTAYIPADGDVNLIRLEVRSDRQTLYVNNVKVAEVAGTLTNPSVRPFIREEGSGANSTATTGSRWDNFNIYKVATS